ncbi:MAG: MmgE/PrpD family protein [Burkholderiaceae bacterium]
MGPLSQTRVILMSADPKESRELAGRELRALFDWTAEAASRPLPRAAQRRAATILADDIGAIIAGSREPQVEKARAGFLAAASGAREATVFARAGAVTDRAAAACANGMAITWCELDEGFRLASCHGGAYAIPALLAEAEARGLTAEEVVRAVALAYELTTRIALAYPFPGFYVHPHAAFATIGAAVAVSLVRGHSAATMQAAVTGAASMTFAGPFDTAVEGSLVRNGWTAAGAWIGMQACNWAEAGIGGGIHTIHDVFATSFRTRVRLEALTAGLGEVWSVASGYHKMFACCNYAHAAVEACLQLRQRLDGRSVDDIREIMVEAGPSGLALSAVEPETVLSAKFSMPHAVAATTRLGTGGAAAFTFDTLADPGISRLRERVRLVPCAEAGPPPHDRPGRVTWTFSDGASLTEFVLNPRGGADQPFDEPTLIAKLADNAGADCPRAATELAALIEGEAPALARGWRETAARIVEKA